MKVIEREYEQFRRIQYDRLKIKNDEFIISYTVFLRRKGYPQDECNRLVGIRNKRLIDIAQSAPMPPFTWTEENIDKRVK